MIKYPDVQKSSPRFPIPIQKVGVKGVNYPVIVERSGKQIPLFAEIDIFVDLPVTRKGADISRNLESVNGVISNGKKITGIEYLSRDIANEVLERFPYSERAEVHMRSDYFVDRITSSGKESKVKYKILGDAYVERNGDARIYVGAIVTGMSACPCAMETTRSMLSEEFPGNDDFLEKMPSITHNQRNTVTFRIGIRNGDSVEIDDLIDIVESALNGPLFALLKRKDEGAIVYNAHKNPKFVEDIVREIAMKTVEIYSNFPDDTRVEVISDSDESIHAHNAYAEIKTDFGVLRKSQ